MLAEFVSQTKNRYLQDVKDGKGADWTVAMGNGAGGECLSDPFDSPLESFLNLVPKILIPRPVPSRTPGSHPWRRN